LRRRPGENAPWALGALWRVVRPLEGSKSLSGGLLGP